MSRPCPECGARLTAAPPTMCTVCGHAVALEQRPKASAVVVANGRFIAVRRRGMAESSEWEIPSEYCRVEAPEVAAARAIFDETGLTIRTGGLIGMWSDSDVVDGDEVPTATFYYLAEVDTSVLADIGSAPVADIEWHSLDDPPRFVLAHQAEMITMAASLIP